MADEEKHKLAGRPKGVPNKISSNAKENVIAVFNRLNGTAGMADWARENLTEFYKLYGKLIPADINHSGSIGQYNAVPTEQRDIDSMAGAVGAAVNGNTPQPH